MNRFTIPAAIVWVYIVQNIIVIAVTGIHKDVHTDTLLQEMLIRIVEVQMIPYPVFDKFCVVLIRDRTVPVVPECGQYVFLTASGIIEIPLLQVFIKTIKWRLGFTPFTDGFVICFIPVIGINFAAVKTFGFVPVTVCMPVDAVTDCRYDAVFKICHTGSSRYGRSVSIRFNRDSADQPQRAISRPSASFFSKA